jgi:hypothetical protein
MCEKRKDVIDVTFDGELNYELHLSKNNLKSTGKYMDYVYEHTQRAFLKFKGKVSFILNGVKEEIEVRDKVLIESCTRESVTPDSLIANFAGKHLIEDPRVKQLEDKTWLAIDRLERKDVIKLMKNKLIHQIYNYLQQRDADTVREERMEPFEFNFVFAAEEKEINHKARGVEEL